MQIIVTSDPAELAAVAAERIATVLRDKPGAVVLAATGNTPMATYARLAAMRQAGSLDASKLRIAQLDEYTGLTPADTRSLYGWMDRSLLKPLSIGEGRVIRLPGEAADAAQACRDFDAAVSAAGGIDLAILGLGPNGHLGFNEPPSPADAPTRLVKLTEESLVSNTAYWGSRDLVPRTALTAGMTTILQAKQVLLLVSGPAKRDILARVTSGPVTPDVPASLLRTHANATVIADQATGA